LRVVAALSASSLGATTVRAQPGDGYYGGHMWGGGWIAGPLMMAVVVAVTVAVVVLLIRWLGGPAQNPPPPAAAERTPLDILKERFARDEIDKQEFEERRRVLED